MADVKLENEKMSRRFVMMYDSKAVMNVLSGLELASTKEHQFTVESDQVLHIPNTEKSDCVATKITPGPCLVSVSGKMSCSACGVVFDARVEQVDHFKSDWHRLNIHQKLKGRGIITETTFERMREDDVSSISGSDSESTESSNTEDFQTYDVTSVAQDDELPLECNTNEDWAIIKEQNRHEKLYFQNGSGEFISVHRCTVYCKKTQPTSRAALQQMVLELPTNMKWAVFMAGGGHFAAAIFDKEDIILHKTFHRYVVRAKAGTAQSSKDNQGNAPKSGGATLRRYNEAALAQEIQELITSWTSDLNCCSRIFLRAPSFNRAIFFGGKNPVLDKNDPRLHHIGLRTRRPTMNEVKRIHKLLATVECLGSSFSLKDYLHSSIKKDFTSNINKSGGMQINDKPLELTNVLLKEDNQIDNQTASVNTPLNDSSSSESDVELQMEQITLDTQIHREYECTRKPKKKKVPTATLR